MTAEVRNGWTLIQHRAFRIPFDALVADVRELKRSTPDAWMDHPRAKLLKRMREIVYDEVPGNPDAPEYRLGNTLGKSQRHWRRAKFLGRFRLFFRFDSATKIIIFAWVNDESTLRKSGAKSDAYAIFKARLTRGDPPDGWAELLSDTDPAE